MRPWIAEAANITIISDNPTEALHTNTSVLEFLENDNKNFISATKGFGKTYLLKLKSHQRREKNSGATFIPKHNLVDRLGSVSMPTLSYTVYNQYNDVGVHELLWNYSFILTIIRNTPNLLSDIKTKDLHYPTALLPNKADYPIVQDVYLELLRDYTLFKEIRDGHFFRDMEISLRNSQEAVYIFIDNVDEFYDNMQFIHSTDIWYHAQIALLRTVVKLTSQMSHIHISATIRKKALDELKKEGDVLYAQYKDSIVELKYSAEDLKKIFINNIKIEQKTKLIHPHNIKKKYTNDSTYLKAFIGFSQLKSQFQKNKEEEEIFSYIYRHTLGRPRDLMKMGRAISELELEQRDENRVRIVINTIAKENGEQYIHEINQFTYFDFDKIYTNIEKNILSIEDLKQSCCHYNGESLQECTNCNKKHIFCTLYEHGLIGIEKNDINNNICIQSFISAGYQPSYDINNSLPISSRYFIHPCLSEVVETYRKEKNLSPYSYSREIIVGYDRKIPCLIQIPPSIQIGYIEVCIYPVTLEEYDLYCQINEIEFLDDEEWGRGKRPAINMKWESAVSYAKWLSQQTGQHYRLPTKDEWENFCGGESTKWCFGDNENELQEYCWYNQSQTHNVGEKRPNKLGLYDLHGNVWEWCSDSYDGEPNHKVIKGGAYNSPANDTYIAITGSTNKHRGYNNIGFRLVKDSKTFRR